LVSVALAAEEDKDEAPPPPVVLKHIPPRFSWNIALHPSYGMLPQFAEAPTWMGLGVRGEWGKHFGSHRLGPGLAISLEGPLGVEWSTNFEPLAVWDYVSPKGLWVGASGGVDLILNATLGGGSQVTTSFDLSPSAAVRLGFSQQWSMIARRFFFGVEGKFRYIDGTPAFIGAIVIGSGMGY
jgi:hypothetical protein